MDKAVIFRIVGLLAGIMVVNNETERLHLMYIDQSDREFIFEECQSKTLSVFRGAMIQKDLKESSEDLFQSASQCWYLYIFFFTNPGRL